MHDMDTLLTISETHTDDAYDFYNSADWSKRDFEIYAASHGVVLFGEQTTYQDYDWADVVMSLYDAGCR